jgi:hypothetical protein
MLGPGWAEYSVPEHAWTRLGPGRGLLAGQAVYLGGPWAMGACACRVVHGCMRLPCGAWVHMVVHGRVGARVHGCVGAWEAAAMHRTGSEADAPGRGGASNQLDGMPYFQCLCFQSGMRRARTRHCQAHPLWRASDFNALHRMREAVWLAHAHAWLGPGACI